MPTTDPTRITPNQERSLAIDYAAQALRTIVGLSLAANPPDLLHRLVAATSAIGASASVYTAEIPEDGIEPSCFCLFACDPRFAQQQSVRDSPLSHPWFRFAKAHSIPGTDKDVLLRDPADIEAIQLARQHGFRSTLIIPTAAGAKVDRIEMLCLGSYRDDAFAGEQAQFIRCLARALAAELHDWLIRHLAHQLREAARLQPTDVDLLKMEWQGLGTKEISLRTGMTPASVDSRFQRINIRLNCPSRSTAAKRAAAYGVLE
ncbi:helix-turn-helix transcriptional regulator [Roseateles sp. NT4]|uniref:helix-turn-helix transcriptional regulator n=1 Tax=Roseateles sp. NT4 TaxID=3453715 RepID=UPI003EEBB51F